MIKPFITTLFCLAALPAAAGGVPEDIARVDLIPGWRTSKGTHMAALRVRLAPGWKTYWRAPGDTGIPPRFDFAGSDNVAGVAFHWPTPEVFHSNGMTSVGYADQLILPIEVRPQAAGDATLRAEVDLGVCHDICVPLTVTVAAALPAAPTRPDATIRTALADRPQTAGEAGAGALRCDIDPESEGLRISAQAQIPLMGAGEFAVVELGDPGLWVSEARLDRQGGRLTASVDVQPMTDGAVAVDRAQVRVTVIGSKGAVELLGCT